ncbi:MAG: squalene--hopene cyclase [Candidatus Tectomicrobia bacterium]|uniref:Squalene--hopene cyclase n=1 Tax=Tectimicrobiota bacterium TaxID=2528274 RepID=A0A932CND1_UNCTE|nr:squalene--hopene cyclase [Candidatus Tectomicrobia bacterium]
MSFSVQLNTAIARAQQFLLGRQDRTEGFWIGHLASNASITAEYIMLHHYLGRVDPQKEKRAVDYILSRQLPDGSWNIYYDGPGDLSVTAEAYVALKLSGLSIDQPCMVRARDFIGAHGGIERVRVFSKIHLALLGLYPWEKVPHIPPEILFLPKSFPLNIYQMSSWARSCVVPLSVIMARHPCQPASSITIDELYSPEVCEPQRSLDRKLNQLLFSMNAFLTGSNGPRPWRRRAIQEAERWILEHQEPSGDWGGIIPAMLYSLLALLTLGYSHDHPVIVKGLESIERFTVKEGDWLWLQSCVSPIWDTAWSLYSLSLSGISRDHPPLAQAAQWLLAKEISSYGDWRVKNRKGRPGGWSFEFHNTFYPDVDDTCVVILALKNVSLPAREEEQKAASLRRAIDWVISMQGKDGGLGAFDKDNNQEILNRLPFADHKAMLDKSCPDLTGRFLEALGALGYPAHYPPARRAILFLQQRQERDGSWYGRWGVNYIYGTWSALVGLNAIGLEPSCPEIQRGAAWLKQVQNPDGGWGETCHSYVDLSLKGQGKSTPSQTAWAILGLIAAGEESGAEVRRGIEFLLRMQKSDGGWEEKEYTGTGFPGHFYLNYQMYRYYFPLLALSKYRSMNP